MKEDISLNIYHINIRDGAHASYKNAHFHIRRPYNPTLLVSDVETSLLTLTWRPFCLIVIHQQLLQDSVKKSFSKENVKCLDLVTLLLSLCVIVRTSCSVRTSLRDLAGEISHSPQYKLLSTSRLPPRSSDLPPPLYSDRSVQNSDSHFSTKQNKSLILVIINSVGQRYLPVINTCKP